MTFNLFFNEPCPKCHKPLMQGVIEAHPSTPHLALQNFEWADCGPVKTKVLSR
jgi:hypothetical protein